MMALLLGDSIFKRLLLKYGDCYHSLSTDMCVSGSTVEELRTRVKSLSVFPNRVVLLVGINDLTRQNDITSVWSLYVALVRFLLRQGCHVFVCQLLPVANHRIRRKIEEDFKRVNFWISNLKCKSNVTVISFESLFLVNGVFQVQRYCSVIKSRADYLHPNSAGLAIMHKYLQSILCD